MKKRQQRKRSAPGSGPAPAPEPAQASPAAGPEVPPIPIEIPFDLSPKWLKGMQDALSSLSADAMFTEVMPWGVAGFAIGALSGLVVYAKKYSVAAALKELDTYAEELLADVKKNKKGQVTGNSRWPSGRIGSVTAHEVELRLLKELRERLVALEPKKSEPVKIEITQKPPPKKAKKDEPEEEEGCC